MDTSGLSLCQLLLHHEQNNASSIYLKQPRQGVWHTYTWADTMRQARLVARFLLTLGLKKGDHVSIFSKNCAEWIIADFGICLAGMVSVPLFANQHKTSIEYVLKHAEVKLVFIGKLDYHQQVRTYIPSNVPTISFDYHTDLMTDHGWSTVLAGLPLEAIIEPEPDDLFTIIYSSGTSATPKGAMYTYACMRRYLTVFALDIQRVADLHHYHLLSYLPLAHVYERSAIQLGSLAMPCDIAFIDSLESFVDDLNHIKPTLFAAVPRIWGVFKQKIEQKISPNLLKWLLRIPFVAQFIKHKVKHQLGLQHCVSLISGAAHLPIATIDFFEKLAMPLQEGYGQTENFAYGTLSMLKERKPGYVGTPRLQVEIKLGENNELLMKSPCLMKGYYKDPEATAAAFTGEGWLHTGDIVKIDALQRVKIVGRISENFKNQKGEFIVPSPIEERFAAKYIIDNGCLVGRGLVRNVLIVSLTREARHMPKNEVMHQLQARLQATNRALLGYEKISHVLITDGAWTTENELLTPTLKVKRWAVEERYKDFIQRAITQPQGVVWES